ncbi:LysE family translocator [Isoptericola jiangsuensis]|uniref:LysE family translocator n=1 Tax=Isoptericola jiangsuensis TaxID=548579 RepID=UPI003AB01FF5
MPSLEDMDLYLPSLPLLLGFLGASLVTLAVPGPSVAYVVARSTAHGRRAGLLSVLGLETGATVHVLVAAVGLGALIARSPVLFEAVRWAGVAYLVWLGTRELLRVRQAAGDDADLVRPRGWRLFADGVLVDVLNPKTAIFFLAFLPQFVSADRGGATGQLVLLGLLFVLLAAAVDATFAVLAGRFSRRLRASARSRRRVSRVTGGVYLALAGTAIAL